MAWVAGRPVMAGQAGGGGRSKMRCTLFHPRTHITSREATAGDSDLQRTDTHRPMHPGTTCNPAAPVVSLECRLEWDCSWRSGTRARPKTVRIAEWNLNVSDLVVVLPHGRERQ